MRAPQPTSPHLRKTALLVLQGLVLCATPLPCAEPRVLDGG